jgi:excisionase family DNA binding protein
MTTTQAAAILGIHRDVVRQQIIAGRIRATKVGRDWSITPGSVRAYDEARKARRKGRSVIPDHP